MIRLAMSADRRAAASSLTRSKERAVTEHRVKAGPDHSMLQPPPPAKSRQALAEQAKYALVETLFASPTSLAIGAIAGSVITTCAAFAVQDLLMELLAMLVSLVGAARVWSAIAFRKQQKRGDAARRFNWDLIYELGAWTYAFLLGTFSFFALIRAETLLPQLMAVTLSTGYAGGIAGRNAGRPAMAIGQLSLAALPVSAALFFYHEGALAWILASVNVLFVVSQTDITLKTYAVVYDVIVSGHEKMELAERYEELARTDALTGLDNRSTLSQRLTHLLDDRQSHDGTLVVLWIDLDRFKEVNDSLGHSAGDAVLLVVSDRLKAWLGQRGWLARFGGDEFVMLYMLPHGDSIEAVGQSVLDILSHPFNVDGLSLTVTASVGAAVDPGADTDTDRLLKHADMALYHSKARGRNAFCVFDSSMQDKLLARREMETNLRMALERGELDIHYQPIIDVQSNRVIGCEALLRWTHPEKGAISPSEFIPLAEATGQIAALTEYVLNRACTAATKWPWEIVLSVNISPVLLKHADFSANLLSVLYKSGLPAHRLELEITETALVEDSRQANFMLREFQRLGLRLALDDFGTGFSSLSYLLTYSFDRIKIDRSFVADIGKSRQASAIILSIVNLARTLGIEPVAEGVESEDQLDYVKNVGCSNVQGYYFAKPMPEKNMLAFIEAHRLGTDSKENMTKTARG